MADAALPGSSGPVALRPPPALRSRLPRLYQYGLPLARPIVGDLATVTLFRSRSR